MILTNMLMWMKESFLGICRWMWLKVPYGELNEVASVECEARRCIYFFADIYLLLFTSYRWKKLLSFLYLNSMWITIVIFSDANLVSFGLQKFEIISITAIPFYISPCTEYINILVSNLNSYLTRRVTVQFVNRRRKIGSPTK